VEEETGVARFTLPDLIDLNRLQRMAESLSATGGIPVRILDLDGTQYVCAGLQPICQQFHQAYPLSADRCTEFLESLPSRLSQSPFLIETCPNNLWEAAALVSIAGTPLAILLIGPFFLASELPIFPTSTFRQKLAILIHLPTGQPFTACRSFPANGWRTW
jgi:hypothetical protein